MLIDDAIRVIEDKQLRTSIGSLNKRCERIWKEFKAAKRDAEQAEIALISYFRNHPNLGSAEASIERINKLITEAEVSLRVLLNSWPNNMASMYMKLRHHDR